MKKNLLKIVSALAAGAMTLTSLCAFAETFSDIENDPALITAVNDLSQFGIITGYEDGSFRPQNNLTRAEVCAMLSRMFPQEKSSADTINFTDVDKDSWAYGPITKAATLSIVDGYEDNTFKPDNNISYQEYIKIIISMVGYKVYAEDLGGYPHGYMKVALANGVTIGLEGFNGADDITRRDAALMLDKILDVPFILVSTYNVRGNSEFEWTDDLTFRKFLS